MIVDISASGVGPRRGFTSVARAAWAPVGADATKPPICGRNWAASSPQCGSQEDAH